MSTRRMLYTAVEIAGHLIAPALVTIDETTGQIISVDEFSIETPSTVAINKRLVIDKSGNQTIPRISEIELKPLASR